MVKKRGMPSLGELVLCKISRVNPNSAFATLDEYGIDGMIHISEIAYGWIRDIRKHIRVGQGSVAKVVRIDGNHVFLSLKRVDPKQKNEKMKEYRMNQKAEKMLEIAAGKLDKSLDQAYEEAGFLLQESFGSLYKGFEMALKNPDALKGKIPEEWTSPIKEVAEKNIVQKEFVFKASLCIKSYKPNGINIIKKILKEADGMEIVYITAPEYLIKYKTKEAKKGKKDFSDKLEKLTDMAKAEGCEVTKALC